MAGIFTCYFLFYGGVQAIKELQINREIRAKEVRLIGEDGDQVGVVSIQEALERAEQAGLDLVNVAPNAKPPVTRIIDYGKYRYDQMKKAKEAKKKQATVQVKEVRMSPSIEEHDLNVKANQANKFFQDGNRVKVSIRFRGREMAHKDLGRKVLDDFAELVKDYGKIDKKPSMEGRSMAMFMDPKTDDDE